MTNNPLTKSLRLRMVWQFSTFIAVMMLLIAVGMAATLTITFSRNLERSLSVTAARALALIEQRVSYLAESTIGFSRNHIITNSLIDPQGRDLYLPRLVADFSETRDVRAVTVVDFSGETICSTQDEPPDYSKTLDLWTTLAVGKPLVSLSTSRQNIVMAFPVEYYQTPQGAVVVELSLQSIISGMSLAQERAFFRLHLDEEVLLALNYSQDIRYVSLTQQAGEELPYLNGLDLGVEIGAPRSKYMSPVRNNIIALALIGVVFVGAAVIIGIRIGNGIVKPVLTLCEKVKKSATGEEEKCSPLGTGDELEELAKVFDERTALLMQSREHLAENVARLTQEITERKRTEESLRSSQEQLRQAQKLEVIGRLAGGVAHDFNNLLTPIIGYSELISMESGLSTATKEGVKEIRDSAERAAVLTQQLLAFSRKQVLQPRQIDPSALVANLEKMLKRLIPESVALVTILDEDVGLVNADPGQIEQVIVNLAVNARDAMPEGGTLTIKTKGLYLGESFHRQHPEVTPGDYVLMAVSDTGRGMDEETKEHVFDPFFTTKELGKGTGLGLSTVYGIVNQSGGSVWIYSEPGQGTTFKIYLPQIRDAEKQQEDLPERQEPVGGNETILLVEDDESLRQIASKILQGHGYRVVTAGSGAEALEKTSDWNIGGMTESKPDLLITDVIMPGMNGKTLADKLLEKDSALKVLFMSSYTDDTIVHKGVLDEGVLFLPKPFSPQSLAGKVREILDSPE